MCNNILTAKFLKFESYWKWELVFSGIYNNIKCTVDINLYNNYSYNIPLNKLVSIVDLSEEIPVKITSQDIAIDTKDISENDNTEIGTAVIDDNDDILKLKMDEYVPTELSSGQITYRSLEYEVTRTLDYTSGLYLKYYSPGEF